ncbi:hypothetical protein BH09MYX1_BH09MYX1_08180 [soil metagenome]
MKAMEIVYAAYTETGTFMLDERGVCRWAVAPPGKTQATVPERIVGAQYVATLDLDSSGGLVDLPRVGCPMLFASVDDTGRIQLVRTQAVTRFENKRRPSEAPVARSSSAPPWPGPVAARTVPAAFPAPSSVRPLPAPPSQRPPRESMIAPKMPPPPRAPSMTSIPTPSAMRPIPSVSAPPRRQSATIPPPPETDPSPAPVLEVSGFSSVSEPPVSKPRIAGLPSGGGIQSMPTRIKGSSTQMRRMIRGR